MTASARSLVAQQCNNDAPLRCADSNLNVGRRRRGFFFRGVKILEKLAGYDWSLGRLSSEAWRPELGSLAIIAGYDWNFARLSLEAWQS